MRSSLLLCLLPLLFNTQLPTPQISETADAITASQQSKLLKSSSPPGRVVTFANRVKTTKPSHPASAEGSKIKALLKSKGLALENLNTEKALQTQKLAVHGLFVAQFISRPSYNMSPIQIKIPETGAFQLRLTEGPVFKIVDQDATDGHALIQMPAATLSTWLYLPQNRPQNSSLAIEDPLYYVKDTVSAPQQNTLGSQALFGIGLRPLPVPDPWQSPYGKDLVLNFTAQNVPSFQMIWLRHDEKPAKPPLGTQEIGPEGGTVELPGVGKLDIPTGALNEKMVITIRQEPEASEYFISDPLHPEEESIRLDFLSPVIKISPSGINFSEDVGLKLSVDEARLGNHSPFVIKPMFSETLMPIFSEARGGRFTPWIQEPELLLPFSLKPEDMPLELKYTALIKRTGYYTYFIDSETPQVQ